ncbi:MAG: hypothetical protein EPO00_06725 [Chloroflexota bacterium]|nr:MAG: hypothetical protein EPO00_06725 [Chloroflexota bacterium]
MDKHPTPQNPDLGLAVEAYEAFLTAATRLYQASPEQYVHLLKGALGSAVSRGFALALIEREWPSGQKAFVEDLVELVGLDVYEAYRAAAILRSITDAEVEGRALAIAMQILERPDADDLTFTRLGHLLKALDPALVDPLIEIAGRRNDADFDEVIEVLRRPAPRWRI